MIGVQVEGARQEGRERIGACEIRVSAVLSTGSSSVDRERRADAFTRSLLEASQTHTVRLRYETSIESRLDLSVSLADHPVPSDWSHLEAVLQGATGFAFERTGSCDRQEIGPVVAFAPPSIVGSASRPTTIGFGSRISAKCASVAQLPVLPWLLPNGIDEAVSLVVAVGEPAMIEVELQRRQLGPTEADTLQALYEALHPGHCRIASTGALDRSRSRAARTVVDNTWCVADW